MNQTSKNKAKKLQNKMKLQRMLAMQTILVVVSIFSMIILLFLPVAAQVRYFVIIVHQIKHSKMCVCVTMIACNSPIRITV